MNILITGGAGYIGSHVVLECLEKGYKVFVLDDLSLGSEKNIDSRAEFIKGSTLSKKDLNSIFSNNISTVIHLAAYKAAGESMIDPSKYSNNNLVGTLNLLNMCDKYGIKFFVFSSTAAVYGVPKYTPLNEKHSIDPINYYGESKYQIERNLQWFSKLKGIRFASLRYFNAAGYDVMGRITSREQNPQNLIPIIMEVANRERKTLEVYGADYKTKDGTGIRDYIHVSDLSSAHIKAMDYISQNNKDIILNLGTGKGNSVFDIIKKVEKITKRKISYKIVGRRNGDTSTILASAEEANKILNWKPKFSDLDTIISSTWNIYDKN